MSREILGVIFTFLLTVLLAIPIGKYISDVFLGKKTLLDFLEPVEKLIFRACQIDPNKPMDWKEFLKSMLTINLIWFIYGFILLCFQGRLPLNPDNNPDQSPHLAFNTVISFLSNCNWQSYAGETGVTYLTQLFVITFLQFVSAATGFAAVVAVFNSFKYKTLNHVGNFWSYFLKSITRILIPLSIIVSIILVFNGTPAGFAGKDSIVTLEGDTVQVSRGPAAGMIAIKQLGTNGGGWFGANSAHPFENPNYLTNIVENISIILLPMAIVFAFGFFTGRKKLAMIIFGVMAFMFVIFSCISIYCEVKGNPEIARLGINQQQGNMEGKEVRIGSAATAYWSVVTTATSNGSVDGMHDSLMPISGAIAMLGMMINAIFGGIGAGFLNYYLYIIIAVFISGLMVGRTPELIGHKVETREIKIAALVTLLSPLLIVGGTAIATYLYVNYPHLGWDTEPSKWLNNPGPHGFSEMLYAFVSSNADNGSAFAGLNANNIFWNIALAMVILLGRFIPIIGPVAIAGLLSQKKYIPESSGTLKIDTITFGLMTLSVIIIITVLSYLPLLFLGPIIEYLSIH